MRNYITCGADSSGKAFFETAMHENHIITVEALKFMFSKKMMVRSCFRAKSASAVLARENRRRSELNLNNTWVFFTGRIRTGFLFQGAG